MKDLIKALNIFLKYSDSQWPTHCEHDILMISDIRKDDISEADKIKLLALHFYWDEEYDCWASGHYGSA